MTVKVGFIGAGNISRAHRRHLKRIDDVAVVAVCDVDRTKAAEAAAEWGASVFTDYRIMLDKVALDAVYICVPPFAHETQEVLAAEKGIALFVEKPIALHMETAREADAAIREHGVISCVGFQGRYLDIIGKTRDLLASRPAGLAIGYWMGGLPGTPWWRRKQMSGGQAVEQTVHVTDMARYLFGDVKTVYAGGPYRIDVGRGGLRYRRRERGHVDFRKRNAGNAFFGLFPLVRPSRRAGYIHERHGH